MLLPIYATLDDLKRELSQLNSINPTDSAVVDLSHGLTLLNTVSRRVDSIMAPGSRSWFGPIVETRRIPVTNFNHSNSSGWFRLGYPLVSLDTATYGDDITSKVTLDTAHLLQMDTTGSWGNVIACQPRGTRLEITGTWGRATDPDEPWLPVDVLVDGVDAAVTLLPINASAAYGLTGSPLYSPGRVLQVGDELMLVTSIDVDEVTVLRGQLRTTAASHLAGDVVSTWEYPAQLTHAVARQAAMLYARRGAFQAEMVDGVGLITYPPDVLQSLYAVLTEFQLA